MTKPRLRLVDSLQKQMSFFDQLSQSQVQNATPPVGAYNIMRQWRCALSFALKSASQKSRLVIADEMSRILGVRVSKYRIDSWVAENKASQMPAEYVPAFCHVTGCLEPIRLINEACEVFMVSGPDALRAEIRKDEEAIKAKRRDKREKEALLGALIATKKK